jgi:hypothetical protein
MDKKRIYLSGKITGLHPDEVVKLFTIAEAKLENEWLVVSPLNLDHSNHAGTWEHYLVTDIKALFDCDAIFMLSNWPTSRGARIERAIAFELGKLILYEQDLFKT